MTSSSSGAAFLEGGAGAAVYFLTRPFAVAGDFSLFLSSAALPNDPPAGFFSLASVLYACSGSLASSLDPPASALILSNIGLSVC